MGHLSLRDADTTPPNKKIFCFSDTHIGLEEVSSSQIQMKRIKQGINSADEAWLLGDIFELTFLENGSREALLERAKKQLEIWDDYGKIPSKKHKCTKHIVWGDHEKPIGNMVTDDMREWTERFRKEIAEHIRKNNLDYVIHENDYVQDGDVVGVHGHLGFGENTFIPPDWARDLWVTIIKAVNGGDVEKFVDRPGWMDKILAWMKENTPLEMHKIRNVLSGHLHNGFVGERYRDKGWYNTGATIWKDKDGNADLFKPITFEIEYSKSRESEWMGKAVNFQVFGDKEKGGRKVESSASTFIVR